MFAHGYQVLSKNTEVEYHVTEFYNPDCERGLRYDDAIFGIHWPLPVSLISQKDLGWPLLVSQETPVEAGVAAARYTACLSRRLEVVARSWLCGRGAPAVPPGRGVCVAAARFD